MSTFDNMGKKLSQIAEVAVSKAKEISEIAKLNAYISSEERQIETIYIEIGKLIYEQSKDEAIGYLGELCEKINESKTKIHEYKEQIEQVKNS